MKKTQVALAALALVASTAVMADGVTVYGSVDTSVAKQSGGKMGFDGSGNWNGSVFGFKGSEDLDNGMKATFQLELGLNLGTGAQDNGGTSTSSATTDASGTASTTSFASTSNFFNRLSTVGLEGSFGSVKLGQQLSPFIAAALNGVANNNESFYVPLLILAGNRTAEMFGAGGPATGGVSTGGFFIPNAVSYTSPTINGLNATVLKQLDAGTATNKFHAYNATYSAGDVSIAAGYQSREADYTGTTLTAAYQMGAIKFAGGYHSYKPVGSTTVVTMNAGASYAVTDALKASVQLAQNDVASAGAISNFGLQYSLSKRTHAYATLSRASNGAAALYSQRGTGVAAATPTAGDTTGYALGVYHTF
jgi:predicted porin